MVSRVLNLSTAVALALVSHSGWADISTRVDKTEYGVGEPVELVVDISQASPGAQLDISSLQGQFEVVGSSQRSSTQIINGRSHSSREIVLSLMPQETGAIQIPSIAMGSDSSEPIEINVSDKVVSGAGADLISQGNLYLESELSADKVYVQQPLLYTLKLYRKVSIYQPQVLPPEVLEGEALVESVGEPKEFRTQVNGETYVLHEIQFTVTPQQSGALKLGPARLVAQVDAGQRQSRFPANSLFADDFFSSSSLFSGFDRKQVRLRSEGAQVNVTAIPSGFKGSDWLPAESVTLSEVWDNQTQWQAGVPVTRKIAMVAQGVAASQLPALQLPDIPGMSQYAGEPLVEQQWHDGVLTARSVTEVTYIPQHGGSIVLPEVRQSWWNVKDNKAETSLIASQSVEIKGVAVVAAGSAGANTAVDTSDGANSATELNKPAAAQQPVAPVTGLSFWKREFGEIWGVVLSLIVIGLLFAMSLFRKNHKRPAEAQVDVWEQEEATCSPGEQKSALKVLRKACQANEPRAAREALIDLMPHLNGEQPVTNLNQLSQLIGSEGADAVKGMNQAIFAPQASNWNGEALWQIIDAYVRDQSATQHRGETPLAPLHLS